MVKHLPAIQETQVWSLGQEDPLEKEMAAHSSTIAWKTPWTVAYMDRHLRSPWSCKESDKTEGLHDTTTVKLYLLRKKKIKQKTILLAICNLSDIVKYNFHQVTPAQNLTANSLTPLVVQMMKNMPTMQETWVWSLGQEDPLEKGVAIHSTILVWRILWTEEPGRLQSMRSQSWTWWSD